MRCTQKVLKRLGPATPEPPESTTMLGDWFVQPFSVGHQRLIVLVSSKSRMPVVMWARDLKNIAVAFPDALRDVLLAIGVPPADVWRELQECRDVVVAATNSRSVLGSANDCVQMMKWRLPDSPDLDLHAVSLWLGDAPSSALGFASPHEVALGLRTPGIAGPQCPTKAST